MFCAKCGVKNSEEAQFCEACGARLTASNPQPGQNNSSAYPPPPYAPYYYESFRIKSESAASVSLTCGIISVCLFLVYFASIPLGIIAIVQGHKARSLGYTGKMATAGMIFGIVSLTLIVLGFITLIAFARVTTGGVVRIH